MNRFELVLKEIGNFVTNCLCPVLSIVLVFAEAFHLPSKWLQFLKNLEYACWEAFGTKDDLQK